jgi:hypothetical protein
MTVVFNNLPLMINHIFSTDGNFNSCDTPEQSWDKENEDNFVYAEFTEGSIVWAKMDGYPWWPAMVQNDPDLRTFYEADDMNPMIPVRLFTLSLFTLSLFTLSLFTLSNKI